MSKRKSSTIFFQTKISSLKIEIGCQTWAKSNLRLLECCSWGKLNWNVISGRWTPFKITNIPAAWMVDSYEYSGIKKTHLCWHASHYTLQLAECLSRRWGLMGFNLNGMINWTRPFMLYWFQEICINHIFCWPAQHGIPKEIPFWQSVLRNIFAEDTMLNCKYD